MSATDKASGLTAERLRKLLDYDPDTGLFRWKETRRNSVNARRIAGCRNSNGYVVITTNYRGYLAHRLAWLYTHGEWPSADIDHINGDGSDNRIANLRQATRSQNTQNKRMPRTNSSGVKGVTWAERCGKWRAQIMVSGHQHNLGVFTSLDDAAAAYEAAARRLHGEFARVDRNTAPRPRLTLEDLGL